MADIRYSDDITTLSDRLDAGLDDHAHGQLGKRFAKDTHGWEAWEGDRFLGGLVAHFGTDWVFVALLYLAPEARGTGTGQALLAALEAQAREVGRTGIWLDTYSFQAPGFYQRMGFTECGRIPDYPRGHARHFFAKRLDGMPLEPGLSEE